MFLSVYKTTLKKLFRSIVFWIAVLFLLFISVNSALDREQSYYSVETNEIINNTDPKFVLNYEDYVQLISNTCSASIMLYALPIFTVITVILVLNHDYRDDFFEIEKAYGQKASTYYFGRLLALVSVNYICCIIASFLAFHLYIYISGGVDGWGLGLYITDSTLRLFRYLFIVSFPPVLLYICFTYMIGNLLKSGVGAGVAGFGYVLLNYLFSYQLRFRIPDIYHSYLAPTPGKLRYYMHCYDTVHFEQTLIIYQTSLKNAIMGLGIILLFSIFYAGLSYLCVHHRKT